MRYAKARLDKEYRDEAYRIYVTDSIHLLGKNTGSYISKRYSEMFNAPSEPQKTGDEIAEEIVNKYGLKVIG